MERIEGAPVGVVQSDVRADDRTEIAAAREALRVERARTAFLSRASTELLGSLLNLQRCMEVAAELATDHFCDAAWVLAPAVHGSFPAVYRRRGGPSTPTSLKIDPDLVPGLPEALRGFPPVPSRWLDPSAVPAWVGPDGLGAVGSVVVVPLPGHGVPAGAIILLRGASRARFTEDEEIVARLFAARAGVAMSAAHTYAQQATITETLLRDLLPPVLHQVDGVEFAGRYRPAHDGERVGGDFYDVHPPTDGATESFAVLGDVCGKGLDAAVLTGRIRSALRALLPMAGDHQQMLQLLNAALLNEHDARFVTVALASVARVGAGARLRLTCAGHPPPLVVRADGRVEEVPTRGHLIGALPVVRASTAEVVLAPGDSCLLYSDGVTEAHGGPFGGDLFGEDRLRQAVAECAGMPPDAFVERLQMTVEDWIGTRAHDDIALLAISPGRRRAPR